MKYHIIINSVKTVEELKDAWSNDDYIELLDKFGFPEAKDSKPEELKDLLYMAISDYEPNEAAAILLNYKLSDQLNEGQIDQMSNDMLLDKISEEYSDIALHHELYNINQLLYKAFNGTFPSAKATIVEFEISPDKEIDKEVVLKVLDKTLAKNSVIKRLFTNHLAGNEAFDEAEDIVWKLDSNGNGSYTLITSEYWMSRDEFTEAEYDAEIVMYEEDEDVED
jgi:hypothetical protein